MILTIDKGDGPIELILASGGIVVKAPHAVWWMHGWKRQQVLDYVAYHKWTAIQNEDAKP